jgi:hypothetical protein
MKGVDRVCRCCHPQRCLLTAAANAVPEPIHDRMPVIFRREDWAAIPFSALKDPGEYDPKRAT